MGTLNAEDVQVHTLFKIANTSAGLTAEWQSPDQSPTWVFATAIKRNGPSLTIEVKGIGATRMCLKLARVADKLHPTIDGPILEGLPFFGRGLRKN